MGASPYFYFVDYEADVASALQRLRQREFAAGRYNPVVPFPRFPIDETAPAPGAQHGSIDEALEASEEDGTRSILDLHYVSPANYDNTSDAFGAVASLADDVLTGIFKTTRPTTQQLQEHLFELIGDINRGMGIYVISYEQDTPDKILFAGYSFD